MQVCACKVFPVLDLWDVVIDVLYSSTNTKFHRKVRESQRRISRRWGRVSIWRIRRWRRSSERFLIYSRILHLKKWGRPRGCGKPLARPPRVVGGVYRQSGGNRSASCRTHFSRLRFGTCKEAQYFIVASQKTEIAKSASEPIWQGLFAEGEMTKLYVVQKKFGDLITADHKVFSEGGESRNNRRYSVVVQDVVTQWIQSYSCKAKT